MLDKIDNVKQLIIANTWIAAGNTLIHHSDETGLLHEVSNLNAGISSNRYDI